MMLEQIFPLAMEDLEAVEETVPVLWVQEELLPQVKEIQGAMVPLAEEAVVLAAAVVEQLQEVLRVQPQEQARCLEALDFQTP